MDAAAAAPAAGTPAAAEDHADMRRLRGMMDAGVVRAGDEVAFEVKASRYVATLAASGALQHRRPGASSSAALETYSSPSEWANTMLKRHNTKRSARSRARVRALVNGWMDCTIRGRSLRELRFGHMRDSKIAASLRDASDSPTLTADAGERASRSDKPDSEAETLQERIRKNPPPHPVADEKENPSPGTKRDAEHEKKAADVIERTSGLNAPVAIDSTGRTLGGSGRVDERTNMSVREAYREARAARWKEGASHTASEASKRVTALTSNSTDKSRLRDHTKNDANASVEADAAAKAKTGLKVDAKADAKAGTHRDAKHHAASDSKDDSEPGVTAEPDLDARQDGLNVPHSEDKAAKTTSSSSEDIPDSGTRVECHEREKNREVRTTEKGDNSKLRTHSMKPGGKTQKLSGENRADIADKSSDHTSSMQVGPGQEGRIPTSSLDLAVSAKADKSNVSLKVKPDAVAEPSSAHEPERHSNDDYEDNTGAGESSKAAVRVQKSASKTVGAKASSGMHSEGSESSNEKKLDSRGVGESIGGSRDPGRTPEGTNAGDDSKRTRHRAQGHERDAKSVAPTSADSQMDSVSRGEKESTLGTKGGVSPSKPELNTGKRDNPVTPSAKGDHQRLGSNGVSDAGEQKHEDTTRALDHNSDGGECSGIESTELRSAAPFVSASGITRQPEKSSAGSRTARKSDESFVRRDEGTDTSTGGRAKRSINRDPRAGATADAKNPKPQRVGSPAASSVPNMRTNKGEDSISHHESDSSPPSRHSGDHHTNMNLRAKAFDAASDSDSAPARKRSVRKKPSSSDDSLDKALVGAEKEQTPSYAGEEHFDGSDKDVRWRKKGNTSELVSKEEGSDDARVQKRQREIEASDDAPMEKVFKRGSPAGHAADSKVQTSASDDGVGHADRATSLHDNVDMSRSEKSPDEHSTASGKGVSGGRDDGDLSDSPDMDEDSGDVRELTSAGVKTAKRQRESGTDADDSADEPTSKRHRGDSHGQWPSSQSRKMQRRGRASRASSRTADDESESNDDRTGTTVRTSRRSRSSRRQAIGIPGLSEFHGLENDPAAAEAAAVAAAAEKEEAISRARRTTRLAAGKIKQVDYKASAIPGRGGSGDALERTLGDEENDVLREDQSALTTTRASARQRSSSHRTSRVSSRRTQEKGDNSGSEAVTEKHTSSDGVEGRRFGSVGSGGSRNAPSDALRRLSSVQGSRRPDGGSGSGSSGNASLSRRDIRDAVHVDDGIRREDFEDSASHAGEKGEDEVLMDIGDSKDFDISDIPVENAHVLDDEDRLSGKDGATGISADSRYATSKMGQRSVSRKRSQKDSKGLDDDDDFSAELNAISGDDDEEPRDEDGWSVHELTTIARAVKSTGSLEARVVFAATTKANSSMSANGRSEEDVSRYLRSATSVIRELCPRTSSAASSEAGIRINDMLSFIAAEVWRLVSGVPRPAGEVAKQVRKEIRMRAALDKSKRKLKRDLEDTRLKLESEMELRRKVGLEGSYLLLRVGECKRLCDREAAKHRKTKAEMDLFKSREQDARERTERIKILAGQLRGERMPEDEDMAFSTLADEAMDGDSKPILAASHERSVRKSREHRRKDGGSGASRTSVEMEDVSLAEDGTDTALLAVENSQEIRRLYALIATYEAEAEKNQRECEMERVRVNTLLESKNKLENDLYMPRPGGGNFGSSGHRTGREHRRADGPPRGPSGVARPSSFSTRKVHTKQSSVSETVGGMSLSGGDIRGDMLPADSLRPGDGSKPISRRKGQPVRSPKS